MIVIDIKCADMTPRWYVHYTKQRKPERGFIPLQMKTKKKALHFNKATQSECRC
jgi:hypothetical protein